MQKTLSLHNTIYIYNSIAAFIQDNVCIIEFIIKSKIFLDYNELILKL